MLPNPPHGVLRRQLAAPGALAGQGFVLPAMLIAGLVVTIGAATITSRALSLRLGEGLQAQANEARDATDSGFEAVIAELNREENRQLAGSNVSMNNWGATTGPSLRNPCLQNANGSPANLSLTSTAISLSKGEWQTLPDNPNMRFRIRSATVKRADRQAWIRTQLSSAAGSVTNSTNPVYEPTDIRKNASDSEQLSRLELTIEGQSLRNGVVVSSRLATQEFGVVPKCCGASIGDNITSLTQTCASRFPSLLIGLNGGGVLRSGSGAQLRELPVGSLVLANTVQKPARLLCVNNSGTCGGNVTTSVDGVPIETIQFQPTTPPTYPNRDNRTNIATGTGGFTIVANSKADSATLSLSTDTQSQPQQDYLRVNSSGAVELCNVTDNNVTISGASGAGSDPTMPSSFVANSCDDRINSYCARTGGAGDFAYHCRIARLHVRDDVNPSSKDGRIQNNTFFIDSSRGRIFLHFNAAWLSPASCGAASDNPTQDAICVQNGDDDGQIQHVYCSTPNDARPCSTQADPDNAPRATLYSDTSISLKIGDDGFIRDLFVYLPKGTLTLAEDPANAVNSYGAPNYRGPLWIDNLAMGSGINDGNQTQIAAPAFSSNFQGLGTPTNDTTFRLLPFFEWIVRGSSWRSISGAS
jgi:hypothetical protein